MENWKVLDFDSRYSISDYGNIISRVHGDERPLHLTRKRISNKLLGTKRTPDQRKRMSEAQQKAKPMLGKHHSKETLAKFKNRKPSMLGKFGKENPNSKPVAMFDNEGNLLRVFDSSLIVFQELNIARESICRCCNGKQKTAGGYKWKYVEKEIKL